MSTGGTQPVLDHLSKAAVDDLAHLAANADKLREISDAASVLEPGVGFSKASRVLAQTTSVPEDEVARVLWAIWNLYRLKDRCGLTPSGLIETVTAVLQKQLPAKWKKEDFERWQQATAAVSEFVEKLDENHPLVVAQKAQQLGFAHQSVLTDARIVTDVRPVFDAAGEKILGSFVTHTLLLNYFDGSEDRRIAFGLDAADLSQLRRVCERAERKALTATKGLEEGSWPKNVFGKELS